MKTIDFRKSLVVASVAMLSACAINPPYEPAKDEKTAFIRLYNTGGVSMCRDGAFYSVSAPGDDKLATIPANKRISLGSHMYFSGYNVSYSCYPFLSFLPKEGETYILHNYVRSDRCYIELVREDKTIATGVALESSVGPRDCFVKR